MNELCVFVFVCVHAGVCVYYCTERTMGTAVFDSAKCRFERAKSGMSLCQVCKKKIDKGTLRCIIPGGPSPDYVHMQCTKWSVAENSRKGCRYCRVKIKKGCPRIGAVGPAGVFNEPPRSGFWHPKCFQDALDFYGSKVKIEDLPDYEPEYAPEKRKASVKAVKKRKRTVVKEEPHGIKVGDKVKYCGYSHGAGDYYTGVVMGMSRYNRTVNFRVKWIPISDSNPMWYRNERKNYIPLDRIKNKIIND